MDFLFIGALPSSAMAEVEIQREALRTSSLQQMLDLERKYKMDRLHSAPVSPPASPPPPSDSGASGLPPLQIRRADSLSRQQNFLMLKAARRSTAPPPLSITIPEPPPASGRARDLSRRGQSPDPGQEDDEDTETETTAEPLHKQVKFLAPDDEDEGDMSDQSSICQSPSWEGYGQRKKEKKKEAERRKKEKEKAEKEAKAEAKAAKKRPASRLSKAPPPPVTLSRNSSLVAMPNPERSMSDPLLTALHSSVESRLIHGAQNNERASSTNDLQHLRSQRRTTTDNLDSGASSKGFLGGVKLDKEKGAMTQNSQPSVYPPSLPYQLIQTSGPEPTRVGSLSPAFPAVRPETRSPKENVFPPSASRTPMLRHMPGTGHSRSNSILQGASKFLKGQHPEDRAEDAAQSSQDSERGRDREQSGQQRSQSSSRTMGAEPIHASGSTHSSSTRSSSRNTQHTRRSSITQDAKTMAMKLAGKKLTPSAKDEQAAFHGKDPSQTDYFNFMERSYSTSVLTSLATGGAPSSRPTTRDANDSNSARESKRQKQDAPVSHEPTPMSRQSSSKEPSIAGSATGSQGKKGRSLRDAAKAALHIGTPTNNSKSNVSVPPYLAFRARMLSQNSSSADKKSSPTNSEQLPAPVPVPVPVATLPSQEYAQITRESSSEQPSSSNSVKTSDLETQAGSRASEGSSSTSSAYEDGSPLPSPNTTPDTSRPQSSKDMPLHGGDAMEAKETLAIQDDEATLRQSSDSSGSSNSSTTPRLGDSTELKSEMTNEERWSRTALPLELDGDADAQSFTTSFSHQDDANEKPERAAMGRKDATQSHSEILNALRMAMSQPKLAKSLSDPALRPSETNIITQNIFLPAAEKPLPIPARSTRRKQSITSPTVVQGEGLSHGEEVRPSSGGSQPEEPVTRQMPNVENPKEEATMKKESKRERHAAKRRHRERDMPPHADREEAGHSKEQDTEEGRISSMTRVSTSSSSLASPNSSKPSLKSPRNGSFPQSQVHEDSQAKSSHAGSRVSTPEPSHSTYKPSGPSRVASAPTPTTDSSKMLPVAPLGPSASRPAGPVSILKQTTRSMSDSMQETAGGHSSSSRPQPHVLSALPKHMQLQAGVSVRPQVNGPESRMAPIAKMFVECCNCKFYHDMPSKLYECMAKPDAVIEDRHLGISGAITTMVKCPWCQHNMSTSCCAGYAAVVYLKEKLH